MTIRILILGLIAALAACATPYKPMGFMGGVDALQLNATTYQITARGNGYTSSERVRDFILLKASELTLTNGYKYFTFAGYADISRSGTITTPGYATSNTTGIVTATPGVAVGSATTTTTYMPPVTHSFFKPGSIVEIVMNNSDGLDAHLLDEQLAPKYGVPVIFSP